MDNKECVITYNHRHYLAKNLTSYTDIMLMTNVRQPDGAWCSWVKEFSFGGDKLKIEEEFWVPKYIGFFKKNPIYTKIMAVYKYSEYAKNNSNSTWLDFCEWVAEDSGSEIELATVIEKSGIIIDLLNKWKEEGKI